MTNHTLIIEPGLTGRHNWRNLWRHRKRSFVFAWHYESLSPESA